MEKQTTTTLVKCSARPEGSPGDVLLAQVGPALAERVSCLAQLLWVRNRKVCSVLEDNTPTDHQTCHTSGRLGGNSRSQATKRIGVVKDLLASEPTR